MRHRQRQSQPTNLYEIISTSAEHQKCIQFLKGRNFSPNTSLQERQIIIQKINNALSNKYRNEELKRRITILQQCASYILQQQQPRQHQPQQPQPQSNNNHLNHSNHNNVSISLSNTVSPKSNPAPVFDDLLSAPITNTNGNSNGNNLLPHITDDARSTTSANTPQVPTSNTNNSNHRQPTQQQQPATQKQTSNNAATFGNDDDFGAFDAPFDDEGFSEFASATPNDANNTNNNNKNEQQKQNQQQKPKPVLAPIDTFDLLGTMDTTNSNTKDANNGNNTSHNGTDDISEFKDFIQTINVCL